ncbi:MAG: TetR/AcrR family transcriptional regulator [Methylobacterium mesophilicum]|nr:TetR/AcrR family transcriptional regulator [Methylobacterium mesophilicum]
MISKAPLAGRRRQQRSIDTRKRIVAAALSEFARSGFDGSSTRGIAEAAGIPHSLVLHHFGGKDALWRETVHETVRIYAERITSDGGSEHDDAASRLRNHFAAYIRFSAQHPDMFRMMTQENTLGSERLSWLVDAHTRALVETVTTLIGRAQADGTFIAGDPLQLLYIFLGAATGPYRSTAELRLLGVDDPASPMRIDAHIAACEQMFFKPASIRPTFVTGTNHS